MYHKGKLINVTEKRRSTAVLYIFVEVFAVDFFLSRAFKELEEL